MTARPMPVEAEIERAARLARERQQLDEAREDVRAGRVVADEDVDSWLDRLAAGESLPEPPREASPSSRAS